jgi:hypothetical protein
MFEDFEFKLRKDTNFRNKITKAISNIQKTYNDSLKNPQYVSLHKQALQEYLKVSNFNLSPLLGFYYPNYPDGPFSLADFPFAHCYYQLNIGPGAYTVYRGSRQIGKCVSYNTKIRVRNKVTKEILEISIGELYDKLNSTI